MSSTISRPKQPLLLKAPRVLGSRITETEIQVSGLNHWRSLATPNSVVFAIPNGGKRNPREAARLRREGVTAGVADLGCIGGNVRVGYIEVKASDGKLSDSQEAFRDLCAAQDPPVAWAVAYGLDELIGVLQDWGLVRLSIFEGLVR